MKSYFSTKTSMSGEDVLRTYIAKLIFDKCRRIPNRKLISHTIKELFGWQRKAAQPLSQILTNYWLDDIMKEERQKFFDNKEAECPICRSHDVKLGLFKDNFECNNCKQEFGGL